MIMSLGNILKIAYAASKVAETGGYLASGGKANQVSNIASVAGQAIGAASTVAGAVNTNPGQASGTAKAGPTPLKEFKPDISGLPKSEKDILARVSKEQGEWLKQQSPRTDILKVNPGGYTANQPKLQEAYLGGLKQSGVEWNDKTRGALLNQMDPNSRQRLLAIDKATVSAGEIKEPNTGPNVMDTEEPTSPRENKKKRTSLWGLQ